MRTEARWMDFMGGGNLFGAQSDDGIDFRGAEGGNEGGDGGDEQQRDGDSGERERIGGAHFVKDTRHAATECVGQRQAERGAKARESEAAAEHEPGHVARGGAEREADADFAPLLCDEIGGPAEKTDRGEDKRERTPNSIAATRRCQIRSAIRSSIVFTSR